MSIQDQTEKTVFASRLQAGELLAEKIAQERAKLADPIVLGIPRGGVPVGSAVSQKLGCPLDVIVLRKLPIPQNPEAGFGAVTLDRTVVLNEDLLSQLFLTKEEISSVVDEVYAEVRRRDEVFRKGKLFPSLTGRSVIITDDGLATGYTMLAAIDFCRRKLPTDVIAAVPVCHEAAYEMVKKRADQVFTLQISRSPVFAVASFYEQFPEMTDQEVVAYLSV
ncbi:MAG: phosphoribosyltransferase [Deltaproteobacteria bacterium]